MSLRDSPFSDVKVPLAWTAALALVVLLVAAIALLAESFGHQVWWLHRHREADAAPTRSRVQVTR